ncbi:MAG: fasciclin domain-containing protein, partial [Marinirhabdus sp.]
MKTKLFPAVIFSLLLAFTACKNDPKDPDHPDGKPPVVEEKAKPSSEMTPEKRFVLNSVMTKAIVTHESKTFSSMLLTVGLNDTLATSDGPYTLLAPNSKVFKNMEKEKMRF